MTTILNGFLALLSNPTIFSLSAHSYSPGGLFYFSFSSLKSSVPSTPYLMTLFLISFLLRISEASEENIPGFPTPLPVYLCLFSALKFSLLGPSLPPVSWIISLTTQGLLHCSNSFFTCILRCLSSSLSPSPSLY